MILGFNHFHLRAQLQHYLPHLGERIARGSYALRTRTVVDTLNHGGSLAGLYVPAKVSSRWQLMAGAADPVRRYAITHAQRLHCRLTKFAGHVAAGRIDRAEYAKLMTYYAVSEIHGKIAGALYTRRSAYSARGLTMSLVAAGRLAARLRDLLGAQAGLAIDDTTGCPLLKSYGVYHRSAGISYAVFSVGSSSELCRFVDESHRSTRLMRDLLGQEVSVVLVRRDSFETIGWIYRDGVIYHPSVYDEYLSDDEDEDEDEDENSDGLLEYHSAGSARERAVCYHAPDPSDPLAADPFTLGFEAEIQVPERRKIVQRIKRDPLLSRVAIMESDGSLCSRTGFETVTGWSTLNEVCKWADAYGEALKDSNYNVHDCGLHIAVGGMSELHTARVMGFVFDADNRPLLRDMAGRDYNGYATDYKFIWNVWGEALRKQPACTARRVAANSVRAITKKWDSSRYLGLNYRKDYDYAGTLEWRLFSGTGNATRIKARLQFVWAVTHYTKPVLCNELTMAGFLTALTRDPELRRHTAVLRDYIVRTAQHKARFPTFAEHADMLNKKELKKKAYEAEKRAAVAATA